MAAVGIWATPLRLLVEPAQGWSSLKETPAVLPAFAYHCAVIVFTWLLNAQLYSEIAVAASIGPAKTLSSYSLVAILIQSVISVTALTLLLAGAVWIATRLLPAGPRFYHCWVIAVNGSLPLAVGWLYSSLMIFFVKPLAADALTALSLLLKPFSLGLASIWSEGFDPLSLPWFFASYLDLFGIWAIVLICIGLARYLATDLRHLLWPLLALVLLLLLLLTGLWQVIQLGIVSAF